MRSYREREKKERLVSEDLDSGDGVPGLPGSLNGNVPERDRNWRRRERQEPKEDWGGCREMQQSYLGMELHPWRGKRGRLGPVAQAAGGARPGGTTVAAETYNPAWSVADEDQDSP